MNAHGNCVLLPYWSASGKSDANGAFPLPQAVNDYAYNTSVTRNITVFNDDFSGTTVGLNWTARLDSPTGAVIASGNPTLNIPLGSRVTTPVTFTTPSSGNRVYLVLSTTKGGSTMFTDTVEYFNLGAGASNIDDADTRVTYAGTWGHATGESGPYAGTNSYSETAGATATMSFVGTGVTLRGVTAPSYGIIAISVDGGAETLVDQYSTARTGDVAVWTSPRLASGSHTIRVRATGTKRAEATHHWATVDRFEVATGPASGTNYRIVSRYNGKNLAVADNSTLDGAKIVQQTANAAWTINAAQGGAYTLRSTGSGKALDVDGGRSDLGMQLQQWTANGGTNQMWYLQPTGDGYFTIVTRDSGLAADVYNWATNDGAPIVQYTAGTGANQQWQLVPA